MKLTRYERLMDITDDFYNTRYGENANPINILSDDFRMQLIFRHNIKIETKEAMPLVFYNINGVEQELSSYIKHLTIKGGNKIRNYFKEIFLSLYVRVSGDQIEGTSLKRYHLDIVDKYNIKCYPLDSTRTYEVFQNIPTDNEIFVAKHYLGLKPERASDI